MSINAISSVSLYEYYYQINSKTKEESQTAKELRELGITPSDDERVNIALLKKAQKVQEQENAQTNEETSGSDDRPWADIMDQLGLAFNSNPKDDIEGIKAALANLVDGIDDAELLADVRDLDNYVQSMYIAYCGSGYDAGAVAASLSKESAGIAAINMASAF